MRAGYRPHHPMALANLEHLLDFDYSVRVNLSNSSLCGHHQRLVVLKLRLARSDGSERQVDEHYNNLPGLSCRLTTDSLWSGSTRAGRPAARFASAQYRMYPSRAKEQHVT